MTATTVPVVVQIKRRQFIALILALILAVAALIWATVAIVIDGQTVVRKISTAPPTAVASPVDPVAVKDRPISVANAYHGVGIMFCLDDSNPTTVADAYHGVGLAVCI